MPVLNCLGEESSLLEVNESEKKFNSNAAVISFSLSLVLSSSILLLFFFISRFLIHLSLFLHPYHDDAIFLYSVTRLLECEG